MLALVLALALAPEWAREVEALRPADTSAAERAVLDALESRARETLAALRHPQTRAETEAARPRLRRQLEEALGYRRLPRSTARPRVTGTLRRPGYRIEKIVFESLPGVEVPAHLYVPDGLTGRAPAILFYNGHWWNDSKTKPDFQSFCITMARLGFVVFSFDPFGQGERGVSSRDHRRVESLLVGVAQQGFAELESQCALDYLLSRKEVDVARVGMTGASGGGYNTWITATLDDRIKVAVPVVGTSDFYRQIQHARTVDWYRAGEHCHFIPGLLRFADNHEFTAMVAPRPLLIINAATDAGFPIGTVAGYGKSLYATYGAGERFACFEDTATGHGYQQAKREAAYGWFLKWLAGRGDGRPYAEPPHETLPFDSPELRCLEDGQKRPAGPGMIAAVKRMAAGIQPRGGFRGEQQVKQIAPTAARVQRLEIPAGDGVTLPAFLVRAERERGLLIAVDDRGKEALATDEFVLKAWREGWSVAGVDVRGIGELTTSKMGWVSAVSLLAGENFVERQARDLLLAAGNTPLALYARGDNAALAAAYAVGGFGRRLCWYVLRNGFTSFRDFLERPESLPRSYVLFNEDKNSERMTAYDREIPFRYFVFDGLRRFDIPQLLARSAARGYIVEPADGDWKPASRSNWKEVDTSCGR
ncbi:MAG: prolyl oligopeptidase family serine peptidase [Acidobacteria bacterium]|nr:prolyl oligopeptidase family serine peptidase [Acidobacteriota bacterium]